LEGVSPPVWRRLQVPGDARLGWLHAAIQLAMGWTNSHLHQFIICDRIFSDPLFEMNEYESTLEWLGGKFDPEAFDLPAANKYLRKLKWPHMSMEDLGEVLMRRFKGR
jgi:hypothetical protein